jgi:Rrf2 family protein
MARGRAGPEKPRGWMKLSTKGRYAMVALADLALAGPDDLVSLAEVSKRQDISLPYLEQLFVKLRRAGLVEAVRGPGGGYRLSRSPDAIRISEVLEAVEETVTRCTPVRGQAGGRFGHAGAKPDQPAVGGAFGACLCLPAPDAAVGCDPQRDGALPGGARAVPRGRRIAAQHPAPRGAVCPPLALWPMGIWIKVKGAGGIVAERVYLDWNATTPLRPEARAAMAAAMDVVGNPSSVHAEGRAAKGLIERARAQVAAALGAGGADIVFTSGATEAAALACAGRGWLCGHRA